MKKIMFCALGTLALVAAGCKQPANDSGKKPETPPAVKPSTKPSKEAPKKKDAVAGAEQDLKIGHEELESYVKHVAVTAKRANDLMVQVTTKAAMSVKALADDTDEAYNLVAANTTDTNLIKMAAVSSVTDPDKVGGGNGWKDKFVSAPAPAGAVGALYTARQAVAESKEKLNGIISSNEEAKARALKANKAADVTAQDTAINDAKDKLSKIVAYENGLADWKAKREAFRKAYASFSADILDCLQLSINLKDDADKYDNSSPAAASSNPHQGTSDMAQDFVSRAAKMREGVQKCVNHMKLASARSGYSSEVKTLFAEMLKVLEDC